MREIVCKGGTLGQLKIFHNTETDRYMVMIDNIARENKAEFSLKEFEFILYEIRHYLESQEKK